MIIFAALIYIIPVLILIVGLPRLATWVAALITMIAVYIICTSLGVFVAALDSKIMAAHLGQYSVSSPLFEMVLKNDSIIRIALLTPAAVFIDLFVHANKISSYAQSNVIYFFQIVSAFINLLIFGVARSIVVNITTNMYLRNKASGR